MATSNVAHSLPKDSSERDKIFTEIFDVILQMAEEGDVFAQNELADLYEGGYGTAVDRKKQIYWLEIALK